MANSGPPPGSTYTPLVGLVYIFNLIVGTGALTMPKAFSEAGWLLSIIIVLLLALMSYLTATFMIEAMANANALHHYEEDRKELEKDQSEPKTLDYDETVPLIRADGYFRITEVFELGRMASLFYNEWGVRLLYLCVAVYLYGDLAIYSTAVAKSLRDVSCSETKCFGSENISSTAAYRILLMVFFCVMNPFTFFDVQKTKYIQFLTTALRWTAFSTMIGICMASLLNGQGKGTPKVAEISELSTLVGVCVYSFMCHHSLPSLITPIKPKDNVYKFLAGVFILILGFYYLLALTGIFTFDKLSDVFTLNFKGMESTPGVIQYFLALFPVVALSSNYPIVAITLRNNLRTLLLNEQSAWYMQKIAVPLLALIPPLVISSLTEDVGILVSVTGAYAGAMIQYVIPVTLVYLSRQRISAMIEEKNPYESPFKSNLWLMFVMIWTALSIIFVSINRITGS